MQDLPKRFQELLKAITTAIDTLDLAKAEAELTQLEASMQAPTFWDDQTQATRTSQVYAAQKKHVDTWQGLQKDTAEALELSRLNDASLEADLTEQYQKLHKKFDQLEIETKLSGEYDANAAILSIHAGTGGTDAQDWAQMLERMYIRFGEAEGYAVEVITESAGEEAGIKSVTLKLAGPYAYGKLQGEHGVHRLVRLSPFNSDNLRQTSFALVEVLPEIAGPGTVEIDQKDLKIDVFRAGGHGGQSVNTTDSAVRVTHIPTGIVVSIQNERSQLQNKETALSILRAKLARLAIEQHQAELSKLKGPTTTEQWGQQIRNYVLHPYSLVKDTRTGFESKEPNKVLDGEIGGFIESYLTHKLEQN